MRVRILNLLKLVAETGASHQFNHVRRIVIEAVLVRPAPLVELSERPENWAALVDEALHGLIEAIGRHAVEITHGMLPYGWPTEATGPAGDQIGHGVSKCSPFLIGSFRLPLSDKLHSLLKNLTMTVHPKPPFWFGCFFPQTIVAPIGGAAGGCFYWRNLFPPKPGFFELLFNLPPRSVLSRQGEISTPLLAGCEQFSLPFPFYSHGQVGVSEPGITDSLPQIRACEFQNATDFSVAFRSHGSGSAFWPTKAVIRMYSP